uniref:NAD-dependent epimerase/dehydratase domain-containing protein n=1 Tax=viral metagenome TaxID=1070528 RepID=A0A6C0DHV4_9ZZZZ
MKKILVTGGSGLVGHGIQSIVGEFGDKYEFIFVSSKDYDLYNFKETNQMFEDIKPKLVIHLAANVGGLYKNMNQKVDMLEKNLMINYNVVKCSHDHKVEKLVACLSTCIFPDKIEYPIDETMLHNGPPHESNDAYAYAKRMLEVHCSAYRASYGDDFVCIIPTNIYGPHDNFDLENAHVLPALIHKCYLAKLYDQDFVVRGTGKPLRQFIYSQDLAWLIMMVVENYKGDNIILSVDENQEVSIECVARTIARCFDYEDRIVFDSSYSDGQYKKTVTNHKLQQLLGHENKFEFTTIQDGCKKTVDWFINKMNIV